MFDDLMLVAKITDLIIFLVSFFGAIITGFSLFSDSSNPIGFLVSVIGCAISLLVLHFLSNN